MLKDFLGTQVFENDVVVASSPYFPTQWVKYKVKSVGDNSGVIEYTDSKKRLVERKVLSLHQFILVREV